MSDDARREAKDRDKKGAAALCELIAHLLELSEHNRRRVLTAACRFFEVSP